MMKKYFKDNKIHRVNEEHDPTRVANGVYMIESFIVGDRTTSELPHIIKVTGFSFVPISNYLPQQGAHFIDLWNGQKTLWSNNTTSVN